MSEPTACDRARFRAEPPCYCDRCDLLVGLKGFHVIDVEERGGVVGVVVETRAGPMGCRSCGVIAHSHGRRDVRVVDVPCFGRPVALVWRKRTWRCAEQTCPAGSFTEQHEDLAGPRALLSVRACWWAINQLRREGASIAGLARQLGTSWRTVWELGQAAARRRRPPSRSPASQAVTTPRVSMSTCGTTSRPSRSRDGGRGPEGANRDGRPDPPQVTRTATSSYEHACWTSFPAAPAKAYADVADQTRRRVPRRALKIATLDPFHGLQERD